MRKIQRTIIIIAFLLIAGLAAFLIIFNQSGFTGTRVKNPDAYLLDIDRMNGTDRHTLDLNAGDVLQVAFKTEKGALRMTITAPDGAALYAGNGMETTAFEIAIPEAGPYAVTVEARHAKGKISVQRQEITK